MGNLTLCKISYQHNFQENTISHRCGFWGARYQNGCFYHGGISSWCGTWVCKTWYFFWWKSFCRPFKCHCLEFLLEGLRIVRTWVLYINLYKPFLLHIFIISSMYHVCIFYLWYIPIVSVYYIYIHATLTPQKEQPNHFEKKNTKNIPQHPTTKPTKTQGMQGSEVLLPWCYVGS